MPSNRPCLTLGLALIFYFVLFLVTGPTDAIFKGAVAAIVANLLLGWPRQD